MATKGSSIAQKRRRGDIESNSDSDSGEDSDESRQGNNEMSSDEGSENESENGSNHEQEVSEYEKLRLRNIERNNHVNYFVFSFFLWGGGLQ